MAEEKPFNPDEYYPSLELAYEVSLLTYDWAIRRLQDVERRIDNLLRLGLTGTVAFPIIVVAVTEDSRNFADYATWPGAVTFLLFLAALILGVFARQHGHITLINPKRLYKNHIRKESWNFKRHIIHYAGKHHRTNAELIQTKSTCADMVSVLFGIEIVFGVFWVLTV